VTDFAEQVEGCVEISQTLREPRYGLVKSCSTRDLGGSINVISGVKEIYPLHGVSTTTRFGGMPLHIGPLASRRSSWAAIIRPRVAISSSCCPDDLGYTSIVRDSPSAEKFWRYSRPSQAQVSRSSPSSRALQPQSGNDCSKRAQQYVNGARRLGDI
jgi:hypothetical protein